MLDTCVFNQKPINAFSAVRSVPSDADPVPRVELRGKDGARVANLRSWTRATLTEQVNAPGTLRLSYPAEQPHAASLARPNEIWVRDAAGKVLGKYPIVSAATSRTATGTRVDVEAQDLLGQLDDEVLLDYSASGRTVFDIVTDWLGAQVSEQPVTLGYIDPVIAQMARSINVRGGTILEALGSLWETVGGHYYVSARRKFYWRARRGRSDGQQLRCRKNMLGVTRNEDTSRLATRLYIYGKNVGGARINLTGAGWPEEYVDTPTQALYGVLPAVIVDNSVSDAQTLLAMASYCAEDRGKPRMTYEVNALRLAEADRRQLDFEAISLGSEVRVLDEALGFDVTTFVSRIERGLSRPDRVRVTLDTLAEDRFDIYQAVGMPMSAGDSGALIED